MTVPRVVLIAGIAAATALPAAAGSDLYRLTGTFAVRPSATIMHHASPSEKVQLNPQPEPPGYPIVSGEKLLETPGHRVMLNPQPEPPGSTERRMLPPGPCRSLLVTIDVGGKTMSQRAADGETSGTCRYAFAMKNLTPGAQISVRARPAAAR